MREKGGGNENGQVRLSGFVVEGRTLVSSKVLGLTGGQTGPKLKGWEKRTGKGGKGAREGRGGQGTKSNFGSAHY